MKIPAEHILQPIIDTKILIQLTDNQIHVYQKRICHKPISIVLSIICRYVHRPNNPPPLIIVGATNFPLKLESEHLGLTDKPHQNRPSTNSTYTI